MSANIVGIKVSLGLTVTVVRAVEREERLMIYAGNVEVLENTGTTVQNATKSWRERLGFDASMGADTDNRHR